MTTDAAIPDGAVTPALELAWWVARLGAREKPAVPAPRALRPLLRFARLSGPALATVRRVLDEDDEFRGRVALAAAGDHEIGRLSWLFLHRPDGWADEAAALVAGGAERRAAEEADRAERSAQRRIVGLEGAVRRAEEAAATARLDADRLSRELTDQRRARRRAEAELEVLKRRVRSLEGERDSARRRADAASDLEAQRAELQDRLRAVEEAAAGAAARPWEEAVVAVRAAAAAATRAEEAISRAVAGVARTAQGTGHGEPAAVGRPARRAAGHRRPRRQPVALPPAVFDDSREAAEFLVRLPGVLVLVDGYNATWAAWPELPVAEQRARLLNALRELAARTGAEIHVVFDGTDQPGNAPPSGAPGPVRSSFSPAGTEADDVLLAMVDGAAANRPVVVASSDRRVRDGVRARGANAISTPQLFAALRRDLG